jgi:hypothetical protein
MTISTPLLNSTATGRSTASPNLFNAEDSSLRPSASSNAVLNVLPDPAACDAIFFIRFLKMATLYVSAKQKRNITSHPAATAIVIQITDLHPYISATALPIMGPNAPPTRGARNKRLSGPPLSSLVNMSPTIEGFSTFTATASPLSMRATTNCGTLSLVAARTLAPINRMLAALKTG